MIPGLRQALFGCSACGAIPARASFPLCTACAGSLVPCPPLCPVCTGVACVREGACLSPWRGEGEASGLIAGYSAAYLLVGRSYSVLRKWKTLRGPLFDQRVLGPVPALIAGWRAGRASAVVPVPQRFARSWRLGGSPAAAVARWIAGETGLPVVTVLRPAPGAGPRQASLRRDERFANPLRFETAAPPPRGSILLVDDFMTTGHTLRAAARALRTAGAGPIHAFCLGARPEFSWKEERRPDAGETLFRDAG